MTETSTPEALLRLCFQDLYAGCEALVRQLPAVAEHARDTLLRNGLTEFIDDTNERARLLDEAEAAQGGPSNLWMEGILDDAERDTESISAGPLLDIAMIGAVRKAMAAELVSLQTAIALADALARTRALAALRANHEQLERHDLAMRDLLTRLSAQAS